MSLITAEEIKKELRKLIKKVNIRNVSDTKDIDNYPDISKRKFEKLVDEAWRELTQIEYDRK